MKFKEVFQDIKRRSRAVAAAAAAVHCTADQAGIVGGETSPSLPGTNIKINHPFQFPNSNQTRICPSLHQKRAETWAPNRHVVMSSSTSESAKHRINGGEDNMPDTKVLKKEDKEPGGPRGSLAGAPQLTTTQMAQRKEQERELKFCPSLHQKRAETWAPNGHVVMSSSTSERARQC